MRTVKKLPSHIQLSPYLKEKTPFYLMVQYFGRGYYVPATDAIRAMLEIDRAGKPTTKRMRAWWRRDSNNESAIRDIVMTLELQVRNNALAGIGKDVSRNLLDRMEQLIGTPIQRLVQGEAQKRENVTAIEAHREENEEDITTG